MKKTFFCLMAITYCFASDSNYLPFPACPPPETRWRTSFQLLVSQAKMNSLEYVLNNRADNSDVNGHLESLDFNFKFGGKLELGYLFSHDLWDLKLAGSFLYSKAQDRASQPVTSQTAVEDPFISQGLVPIWFHPSAYLNSAYNNIRFANARAAWKLDFYDAEMDLGRLFKVGEKIELRPAFGLKSIFTYQKLSVELSNGRSFFYDSNLLIPTLLTPADSSLHLHNNAIGLGPKVALGAKWFLHPNFKLIFDAAGALLFTHFTTSRRETADYTLTSNEISTEYGENFNGRAAFNGSKPYVGLNLGLGWEKCFARAGSSPVKCALDCSYLLENFWKINQLIKFIDDYADGTYLSDNTDLQIQSIVFAFSFSF
ncbi:MAG: Lpg1974 family pore-forming outer membrane protein [Parachlamydiales bacterium]|jgi:hypothetical protein